MKNSKKTVRLISAVLFLTMLLLTSCVQKGSNSSSSKPSSSTSSVSNKPAYSNDTVTDLQGYEFTIASPFLQDDPTGKTLTDWERIFQQARTDVEKKFDCKITILNLMPDASAMQPVIMSGGKYADIIDTTPLHMFPAAKLGYLKPLNEIDGINVKDARWVPGLTNLSTIQGKTYGVNFMRPPEVRYCLYFNKDLLKADGITDDIYQLVKDGKWTFDKFREYLKATTRDTNNDGKIDTYGLFFSDPTWAGISLIQANGGSLAKFDSKGRAVESYSDPKVINALNFYNELVNVDKVVDVPDYMRSEATWNNGTFSIQDATNNFISGKAAFWFGNQYIRPSNPNMNYGMLPLPKGPDATDYVSPSQNQDVFAISTTNKDLDKVIPVFNALAKEVQGNDGESWWLDDVQKDYFQANDKDSIDMYKLNLDKSAVDIGTTVSDLYTNFGMLAIAKPIFWNEGTPASQIDSIKGDYQDAINGVYN